MSAQIKKLLELSERTWQADDAFDTRMLQVMCHANAISATHQATFAKYKNCYQGKDVVLVATGPSLNDYVPIKGAIHVGVNRAVDFKKVKFDYLFIQDNSFPTSEYIDKLNEYRARKFYGLLQESISMDWVISEADTCIADAERYYVVSQWRYPPLHFPYDIAHEPLGCGGSVVFAAMQFVLWTNPKRIYLVGCDCSHGYFNGKDQNHSLTYVVNGWLELKKFIQIYYPKTEIISVNPVGLKGVFRDMIQDSKKKDL